MTVIVVPIIAAVEFLTQQVIGLTGSEGDRRCQRRPTELIGESCGGVDGYRATCDVIASGVDKLDCVRLGVAQVLGIAPEYPPA